MRFASRDLNTVKVLRRIEPKVKRLDEAESYGPPQEIEAVISPIRSSLSIELFGERVLKMKLMQCKGLYTEGSAVVLEDGLYKIVASNHYKEYSDYTLEKKS